MSKHILFQLIMKIFNDFRNFFLAVSNDKSNLLIDFGTLKCCLETREDFVPCCTKEVT